MIVKKHVSDGRLILAVCDSSVHGKIFTEGEKILDLSSSFYKGEEKAPAFVLQDMRAAYIVNAAGEETVKFLVENDIISNKDVKHISKIPYALVLFEEKKH